MLVSRSPQTLTKDAILIECLLLTHHPVTATGQFMRQRLAGDNGIRRLFTATNRKVGRLDKGPGQVKVTVLAIVVAFLFPIALASTVDAPTIRGEITWLFETLNVAGFQQNRLRQDIADTRRCFQSFEASIGKRW
jgi:hypothetical protein